MCVSGPYCIPSHVPCAVLPLLVPSELGIDVGAIFQKTRAVLFWRFGSRQLDDLDMGGALIFVFVLAGLQLLVGWHAGKGHLVCGLLRWVAAGGPPCLPLRQRL